MFKKKKKFKVTLFFLILVLIYGLYALYVAFAHNPGFELLYKNTISYSGLKARIISDNTKISMIKVSLGTKEKSIYPIYQENNLDSDFEEKIISIPFTEEDKVVKFIKKNNLKSLYLYYQIEYENKFFNSNLNKKIKISIDFQPPSIKSVRTDSYVYLGGIGYVIYKTSKDTFLSYVDTGLNTNFYPITIEGDSVDSNLVFFTCGNSPCKNGKIKIVAEDLSGNSVSILRRMKTLKNKNWKTSNIVIDLSFLLNKYNEIFDSNLTTVSIDNFLELNMILREKNNIEISSNTSAISRNLITSGNFYQMRNSKVFSDFSEKRDYYFKDEDKPLMTTYHWGYDLSSIKNAKIYSSSEGLVSYVNNDGLGIYGKTIIINHGLGFYSLYSHLSEILVSVGDKVKTDTIIGRTGESGLAFGDHLHFGTYLQGVPFNSSEVWDKKYFFQKVLNIYNDFIKGPSNRRIKKSGI